MTRSERTQLRKCLARLYHAVRRWQVDEDEAFKTVCEVNRDLRQLVGGDPGGGDGGPATA